APAFRGRSARAARGPHTHRSVASRCPGEERGATRARKAQEPPDHPPPHRREPSRARWRELFADPPGKEGDRRRRRHGGRDESLSVPFLETKVLKPNFSTR